MFSVCLAALPFVSVAVAAVYGPYTPAPKVYEVTVGGEAPNQISYTPNSVWAEPGDVVRFWFKQKNHTVTQSSFDNVCQPLLDTYTAQPTFDTGFMPVPPEQKDNFPYYDLPVTHKNPLWFYCRQTRHCGQGMVFAINAPHDGDKTFDNFHKKALEFGQKEAGQSSTQAYAPTETYAPTEAYPTGSGSAPAATPTGTAGVHRVLVGDNGSLSFDPPSIAAKPQDTIIFEFRAKNHTVTQSSFGAPCRKLEFTSNVKGFDSGFTPVANGTVDFPTFNVTVNDEQPIWLYCRQGNHCGQGMVFAVNPPSQDNFTAFVTLAKSLNGTSTPSPSASSQAASNSNIPNGAAPTVHASMASAALLAVGGLFLLTL